MEMSEKFDQIAQAFVKAQTAIEGAIKNSENDHFHNTYADLSAVMSACKPALTENGIAVLQTTDTDEAVSSVIIVTTLLHSSGQWFRSRLTMPLERRNAQGVGSAITYGRRYALAAMVGVAQVDDDGEGAVDRNQKSQQQQQSRGQQNNRQSTQKRNEASQDTVQYITKEQAETIQGLLDEAGVSAQTFCKKYGLTHLGAMPATWFSKAVTKLENDIQKMTATEDA